MQNNYFFPIDASVLQPSRVGSKNAVWGNLGANTAGKNAISGEIRAVLAAKTPFGAIWVQTRPMLHYTHTHPVPLLLCFIQKTIIFEN